MTYHSRLARLALRDPLKIPSMLRLKTAKRGDWRDDYGASATRRVAPPLVIAVRLNYGCNLRCVMCNQWGEEGVFIKTPERMVRREMTTDDFKRFFDDVAAFRPYIYFTGGEPLMNFDILEVVRHASRRHLVTSMSTNSTYLKEKAEAVVRSGLDYLYTSLDSPVPGASDEATIRRMAKGGDSNASAVDSITHMARLRDELGVGLPIMQVQTIIVKENQHLLLQMAEFVNDVIRPDVWGLQLCVYTTPDLNAATTEMYRANFGQDQVGWAGFVRDFPDMDFDLIQRQIDEIMRRKWRFKFRPYRPIGMKGFDLKTYYTQPDKPDTEEPLTCLNPYVFAQLQPNGDIAFCGSQPDYVIGNVRRAPFLDLWSNERATKWRAFLQKQLFPSCKRCFSLHEFSHFKK